MKERSIKDYLSVSKTHIVIQLNTQPLAELSVLQIELTSEQVLDLTGGPGQFYRSSISRTKDEKMVLGQNRRAVRIFNNRIDAEHAIRDLNKFGFSVEQMSMVALNVGLDEQLGGASISDRVGNKALVYRTANSATITGSMLGAIGGCLLGAGLLAVPGVGLVVVGTSGALIATLGGAGIGLAIGGLIEALAGLGITDSPAIVDRERQGEYLVIVRGTDDEVRRAEYILSRL